MASIGSDSTRYHEHLDFLLQGGKALARAFPRVADRLAGPTFDPDVERLLEGIAFIASKIEDKHDHGLPEICQLMFDVLFPHYLCPVPPATIAEFVGEPALIPRGTMLEAIPVLGTACRFQTAYDVELTGLKLEQATCTPAGRGLQLTLTLSGDDLMPGAVDRLTLHLHGEPLLTRSLFHWLLTRLDSVELLDRHARPMATSTTLRPRPLGYAAQEALFPWPTGTFSGFRLFQEYFAAPEKFLFLELAPLQELLASIPPAPAGEATTFSLRFNLKVDHQPLAVTRQDFRLNCTPVVNLFPHSADPVQWDTRRPSYRVRPAGPHLHYQTYRVLRVVGWGKHHTTHYPLLSELDIEQDTDRFCQIMRQEVDGQIVTRMYVHDPISDTTPQTLLVDLLCSNGAISQGLHMGDSCRPQAPFHNHDCRLIGAINPATSVPVGEELRWRLIRHLALAQRELTNLEAIRDTLFLYNFSAIRDRHTARALTLLLRGIQHAKTELAQHHQRRIPVWGHTTTVALDGSAFDSEAELYLFGCVLNEYVALQASLNAFSELMIKETRSQETYRWPRRLGRHPLTR